MSIVTFPLDVTDYSADALGAWFAARTRGVFAADGHYHITTSNAMSVTVGPGLAWLRMTEYWGVVAFNREPVVLEIAPAGNTLQRVDAVCLQLDKVANKSRLFIKQGEPGVNSPVSPVRDSNVDEIYLATIAIPAGAATVQAAHITDRRLDEHYCGIMSDGTKIPTQQLYDTWMAWFADLKGVLDEDALGNLFNRIVALERTAGDLAGRTVALESASQAFNRLWVYDTVGTFTWVRPAGVSWVEVTMVGGGGGGQGGTAIAGGAGGSSGLIRKMMMPVTGNTQVTIGAGGAGGAGGGAISGGVGGAGGTTSFGTFLSAIGGSGGGIFAGGGSGGGMAGHANGTAGNGGGSGGQGGGTSSAQGAVGNSISATGAWLTSGLSAGGLITPQPAVAGQGAIGAGGGLYSPGGNGGVGAINAASLAVGRGGGGGGGGLGHTIIAGNGLPANALDSVGQGGRAGIGFGAGGGGAGNQVTSGGAGARGCVIVRAIG